MERLGRNRSRLARAWGDALDLREDAPERGKFLLVGVGLSDQVAKGANHILALIAFEEPDLV
jgi:hypothetical protein